MIGPSQRPLVTTHNTPNTNIQALGGIRTHDRSRRAAEDLRLRPRGHWDRHTTPDYPIKWLETLPKCVKNHGKLGVELLMLLYALNPKLRARDSSVGIATRYRLDGSGIESRWRARFSATVQTCPRGKPASYTMGTGSFSGVKAAGAWRWKPKRSSVEDEKRIELYICSPSGPSWPAVG